jgi:hypothetical protein
MILSICSDAAYLVLPNARSRAAGHFFLSTLPSTTGVTPTPKTNGAIHVLCKTLRTVAASASEAETGALFLNAQEAVPMITALQEMGHPQLPTGTPLETDNSTANGILHANVRLKRSKAFDMRYFWLRDRVNQKQFNLYWRRGSDNSADYFSKHHSPQHHKNVRPLYLLSTIIYDSSSSSSPAHPFCPPREGVFLPPGLPSGFHLPQMTSQLFWPRLLSTTGS